MDKDYHKKTGSPSHIFFMPFLLSSLRKADRMEQDSRNRLCLTQKGSCIIRSLNPRIIFKQAHRSSSSTALYFLSPLFFAFVSACPLSLSRLSKPPSMQLQLYKNRKSITDNSLRIYFCGFLDLMWSQSCFRYLDWSISDKQSLLCSIEIYCSVWLTTNSAKPKKQFMDLGCWTEQTSSISWRRAQIWIQLLFPQWWCQGATIFRTYSMHRSQLYRRQ